MNKKPFKYLLYVRPSSDVCECVTIAFDDLEKLFFVIYDKYCNDYYEVYKAVDSNIIRIL